MRVLVVENDSILTDAITRSLSEHHFVVDAAEDGATGWECVESAAGDRTNIQPDFCNDEALGGWRKGEFVIASSQSTVVAALQRQNFDTPNPVYRFAVVNYPTKRRFEKYRKLLHFGYTPPVTEVRGG